MKLDVGELLTGTPSPDRSFADALARLSSYEKKPEIAPVRKSGAKMGSFGFSEYVRKNQNKVSFLVGVWTGLLVMVVLKLDYGVLFIYPALWIGLSVAWGAIKRIFKRRG